MSIGNAHSIDNVFDPTKVFTPVDGGYDPAKVFSSGEDATVVTPTGRKPIYLSPSALKLWENDRKEYYVKYLGPRVPNVPQTAPMAIGSAFDAYVKGALNERYGCAGCKTADELLLSSVEKHNLSVGRKDGKAVFDSYVKLGGYARLVKGYVPTTLEGDRTAIVSGVPLRGKVDNLGTRVPTVTPSGAVGSKTGSYILDWKVNGYYSKASPKKWFVWSSKTGTGHKEVSLDESGYPRMLFGTTVIPLPDDEWMDQMHTYGLLYDMDEDCDLIMHQLTFGTSAGCVVTEYKSKFNKAYAEKLMLRYQGCWEAVQSGRCFTDMSLEDDKREQANLAAMGSDGTFLKLVR